MTGNIRDEIKYWQQFDSVADRGKPSSSQPSKPSSETDRGEKEDWNGDGNNPIQQSKNMGVPQQQSPNPSQSSRSKSSKQEKPRAVSLTPITDNLLDELEYWRQFDGMAHVKKPSSASRPSSNVHSSSSSSFHPTSTSSQPSSSSQPSTSKSDPSSSVSHPSTSKPKPSSSSSAPSSTPPISPFSSSRVFQPAYLSSSPPTYRLPRPPSPPTHRGKTPHPLAPKPPIDEKDLPPLPRPKTRAEWAEIERKVVAGEKVTMYGDRRRTPEEWRALYRRLEIEGEKWTRGETITWRDWAVLWAFLVGVAAVAGFVGWRAVGIAGRAWERAEGRWEVARRVGEGARGVNEWAKRWERRVIWDRVWGRR